MELRHLRYFVRVAEELHFARAARHLGISQPPLSQQIRALEDELGVRLLERTSRRVMLTPAGTMFLDGARATLQQADRAVTTARRAARGELGQLTIGFNASAPFVPQVARGIRDFRQAYPEVSLQMTELSAPAQIEAVDDHLLDLGFMRNIDPSRLPAALAARLILREGLFVAMSPDHPFAQHENLRLRDLAGEPQLVYAQERSSGFTDEMAALFRIAGVVPVVAQTVREVSSLFGLAAAGVGVTILAESLCSLQSAKLVYRQLMDEGATTSLWLLHRRDDMTLPCRHFMAVMDRAE
jgi:DNA-binding transcriptional LysR family regulator